MSRAREILEAIIDVSSKVSSMFNSRGSFNTTLENRLRDALNQLRIEAAKNPPTELMDPKIVERVFYTINMLSEFQANKITFDVKPSSAKTATFVGAGYHRPTGTIIIKVNATPLSGLWSRDNSISNFINQVGSTILHEMTHGEQAQRRNIESEKRSLSYLKTMQKSDPRGNKYYKKYLSTPEEVMAFAAETADLMLKDNDYYKVLIRNYIKNVGRTSSGFKRFLRYVVEYATRRGISQSEAIRKVNLAASENPWWTT